jgi:hypothetical protein
MLHHKMPMGGENQRPFKAGRVIVFAAFYLFYFVVHLSPQITVTPGRVVGNISFINVPPEVSGYLASNPVVNWTSVDPYYFPVRLYNIINVQRGAAALYTPVNTAPDSQTYRAASFDINPNVGPGRRDFILEINRIIFSNGAKYIFGSLESSSPSYHLCQDVLPLTDNPNGTPCDISECAVLLPLRLRFGGAEEDKNAIDNNYPAVCSAIAFVKEGPGSEDFVEQAQSETKQFSVDSLKTIDGEILPILVRASNSVIKILVQCEVKIKDGETGYPIIPLSGMTPLARVIELGPYACGAQPPAPIDVDVPTSRTAGPLKGLFDVSGHNETKAEIILDELTSSYRTAAQPVPAGSLPTVPWEFKGVQEGDHALIARAVLDDGNFVLEFPHRDSFNQRVTIVRQQTKDIGSTFVAKPTLVRGKMVLVDPGGITDLKGIQTSPLLDFYNYYNSYMIAEGVDQVASTTPACCNRSSGFKGRSQGRLIGSYDSAQHIADMNYEVLLTGLSPEDGSSSTDGTDACPAPWNMAGLSTYMKTETVPPNTGYCYFILKLGQYFPLLAEVNAEPIQFPDQKICFGKLRLDFYVNPNLGAIYSPSLSIYQDGVDSGSNEFGTNYSLGSGYASGTPRSSSECGSTATVTATLPEGLRYKIYPGLYFRPASQSSGTGTYMYLDSFIFPETGFLGCGDEIDICVFLMDEQGNYSFLSINYPTDTDYCLTNGNLELNFSVNLSDGSDVAQVGYVLDPQNIETADLSDPNAVIVCPSNCGPNPTYGISLSSLTPGPHALKIMAIAANGCRTRRVYNFYVQSQPLTLHCPADFTANLLPDETSILKSDPRISDHLNATVSGGCGLPATILDDRPDEFEIGQRTVNFWIQGHEDINCKTIVTVAPSERILSFISNDTLTGEQVIKKRTFLDDSLDLITYSSPLSYHFQYNRDGSRMAVIPPDAGTVKIFDTATNGMVSIFPVPAGYKLYDMDFHPLDVAKYAIVGSAVSNPDQHAIFIFSGSTQLSRFDLPLFPPTLRISRPLIAWSPDGMKISATFTDPAPAVNQYGLWVSEWNVVGDQIALPPNGIYEMRPNLQNRENIREMVYQDGDWRVVATNATITRAIKRAGSEQMVPIWAALNADIDLTPNGRAAAYLGKFPLAPINLSRVYEVSPLDRNEVPNVFEGPIISNGKSVAISSDAAYIAVATNDEVLIYSCPDFTLVKRISAISPRNLEFKPFGP